MMKPCILLGMLGWFSIEDIRKRKLTVWVLLAFGVLGLANWWIEKDLSWVDVLAGVAPGIFLILLGVGTRESIGIGDGVLVVVTGIFLGGVINAKLLMISLLYGALCSLGVVLFSKKKNKRKMEIPFAPMLLLGYVTILLGELI